VWDEWGVGDLVVAAGGSGRCSLADGVEVGWLGVLSVVVVATAKCFQVGIRAACDCRGVWGRLAGVAGGLRGRGVVCGEEGWGWIRGG